MTNSDVDAVELLGLVVTVVPSLLVQHSVEGDGSLSGLTITNDQFTLTTTDRYHGVDGLETSLYWLVDGLSGKDTWGLDLGSSSLSGLDWALSVNGFTQSVDDTTKHSLADWYVDLNFVRCFSLSLPCFSTYNLASSLDGLAFLDQSVGTEQHDTDLTGFQVHAHALDTGGEFDELFSLDIAHAMDTGNTVTDGQDTTSLSKTCLFLYTADSLLEDGGDFGRGGFGIGGICSHSIYRSWVNGSRLEKYY